MFFWIDTNRRNITAAICAVAAFAVVLFAPVTIDLGSEDLNMITLNSASAGHKGGGGRRGGRSRGPKSQNSGQDGDPIVLNPITEPTVEFAVFTTGIDRRFPADEIVKLEDPHTAVSFYTVLRAMAGMQVTHRWIYNDTVRFDAKFDVANDFWRVWSTRLLPIDSPGEWTVEVVDNNGKVLAASKLMYQMNVPDQPSEIQPVIDKFSDVTQRVWTLIKSSLEE